ncbi:MAG TPA: hypothetical protein VGE38_14855 [Nocardioides sp.]|uniref:hypothetical protein n=1 Tax=Nocardioides sp. TaxID=35761 RepID=UPI002EDB14A9
MDNVHEAVADERVTLHELHAVLTRKLADLDGQEERLIDLAEEGLPQHKIRERLNKINEERARIEADVKQSGTALAVGASMLRALCDLPPMCGSSTSTLRTPHAARSTTRSSSATS